MFYDDVEKGEAFFRENHLAKLKQVLDKARIFQPTLVRLLAARSTNRKRIDNMNAYFHREHDWVYGLYREAIDIIHAAGFQTTIENECRDCIFSTPQEITDFFQELDRGKQVDFTYDVQNLWEMGAFPSIKIYRELAPLIGYFHLKGGQKSHAADHRLVWKSALEDAAWPVLEITS